MAFVAVNAPTDPQILPALSVPMEIVADPKRFLTINKFPLMFSVAPIVSVIHIIVHFAAEVPGGKVSIAMFMDDVDVSKRYGTAASHHLSCNESYNDAQAFHAGIGYGAAPADDATEPPAQTEMLAQDQCHNTKSTP
ncbi:hypothetical protein G6011_07814 [Alternaria panax]|uniref:Uncharacterized protein n=1 Tax=Alternaria panax TaxID=48097 RepID=A0AAD4F9C2_9PLEO|nr:hypothetical protein G6011_07814 [Alternaria panax]